jgi:predicted Rossmann-fold nucleotide-binding protein
MIKEIETLHEFLKNGRSLSYRTLQQIDFTRFKVNWKTLDVTNSTFLGCSFNPSEKLYLIEQGAVIIDNPVNIPYIPLRNSLYTWQELLDTKTISKDLEIYNHFSKHKNNTNIVEALWQRIHDHAIDDALKEYIGMSPTGMSAEKCIGIMGGHGTLRSDPHYLKVAKLSKRLTEEGYLVVSGGGPGIMEAANLGAFLAGKSDASLNDAIALLAQVPHYSMPDFTAVALEVWREHKSVARSLAIPTWFYGHEPSNVFAPAIAKYFSNSIREDTLLAICLHGVIYAPGSAGTVQEIFMDAAQNHYGTYGYISPMIFLGRAHYELDTMLFPMLKKLAHTHQYEDFLYISDDPLDILNFVVKNPPVSKV